MRPCAPARVHAFLRACLRPYLRATVGFVRATVCLAVRVHRPGAWCMPGAVCSVAPRLCWVACAPWCVLLRPGARLASFAPLFPLCRVRLFCSPASFALASALSLCSALALSASCAAALRPLLCWDPESPSTAPTLAAYGAGAPHAALLYASVTINLYT